MREFVITLEYDPGVDPVADVFIEHPGALSKSVACSITRDAMWRLDRISGPASAIDQLEYLLLDTDRCNECPDRPACQSHREYELLSRDATSCTMYTYRSGTDQCRTLPSLAVEYLGDGLFYETKRNVNQYEWRILMRNDANVGRLYDALQAELSDGITVSLSHLTDPTHWTDEAISATALSYEQRDALRLAVEHGYYQTPRETSLTELASEVDVPQSTLQYRLQRAESWLANHFVTECL